MVVAAVTIVEKSDDIILAGGKKRRDECAAIPHLHRPHLADLGDPALASVAAVVALASRLYRLVRGDGLLAVALDSVC